jgi:hypothetical protein
MADWSKAIVDDNREIVGDGGSRSTSFGRVELRIPFRERKLLSLKYPELDSTDWETQLRAWKRFIASPESKPFRVSKPRYISGPAGT